MPSRLLYKCLYSDFQKLKHTPFIWIHFIVPSLYAIFFIAYLSIRDVPKQGFIYLGFIEIIAVTFPFMIGLLCGLIASQEESAGHFQVIRGGATSRSIKYVSKILILVMMGAFSVYLSISIFLIGLRYIVNVPNINYLLFITAGLWIILGSVILYIMHLFVSFIFGMGPSTFLGGFGLLVTALMNTGLGDQVWKFIPWAWSIRLVDMIGLIRFKEIDIDLVPYLINEIYAAKLIIVVVTIVIGISSILWFKNWEGRKFYE